MCKTTKRRLNRKIRLHSWQIRRLPFAQRAKKPSCGVSISKENRHAISKFRIGKHERLLHKILHFKASTILYANKHIEKVLSHLNQALEQILKTMKVVKRSKTKAVMMNCLCMNMITRSHKASGYLRSHDFLYSTSEVNSFLMEKKTGQMVTGRTMWAMQISLMSQEHTLRWLIYKMSRIFLKEYSSRVVSFY